MHVYRSLPSALLLSMLALPAGCIPRDSGATKRSAKEGEPPPKAELREPSAKDPFTSLAEPTPDPTATPYRFETGVKVPKPDHVVEVPFPPPGAGGAAPTPTAPPELNVLRTQPEGTGKGNEGLIGAVTVTFNQPMIPLGTLGDVKAQDVPLEIEPRVPGRFRWLGTQTLAFEPEERMPMSTKYVARVPGGTTSALGKSLAKEVVWRFETPRPVVIAKYPGEGAVHATPETVIAFAFNQRMDPKTVAALTTLEGPRGRVAMAVVPPSEWASIEGASLGTWDPQRSVVLRPVEPLKKDAPYRVRLASGIPSAEGPLRTTSAVGWKFRTYAPLKVVGLRCAWGEKACPPHAPWQLEFNNPLDGSPLDEKISISPELPEPELNWWGGNVVNIVAPFKPATRYTVTVSPDVTDRFGQTLGNEWSGTQRTGDAPPTLEFPARGVAVVEARGNRTVGVDVVNVFDARVRMVKVGKKEVRRYRLLAQKSPWFGYYGRDERDPLGAAPQVVNRKLILPREKNEPTRVGIGLDEALGKGKPGILYLDLFSDDLRKQNRNAPRYRGLLVQVTDIGLAVKYDVDRIEILATGIEDGKPLEGIDLEILQGDGKSWWTGTTGADGTARAPGVREKALGVGPLTLFGAKGNDLAFVELDGRGGSGWVSGYSHQTQFPENSLRTLLFTDRGIYRPEETVHMKGILRSHRERPGGGLSPLPAAAKTAKWAVRSPRGEQILEGTSKVGAFDSFTLDIPIPRGADLGTWYVDGALEQPGELVGNSFRGSFQVQEYRTPEYKVEVDTSGGPDCEGGTASDADGCHWLFGQTLRATIHGAYYFGAPMVGAETSWTLTRAPGYYAPPGNPGFTFGDRRWRPYWHGGGMRAGFDHGPRGRGYDFGRQAPPEPAAQGTGVLDPEGNLKVQAKLEREDEKETSPGSFTLEAQVFDKNRQAIAGRSTFVVHPAEVYVGMRLNRSVIKEKERIPLDVIAAAIDGSRVKARVDVSLVEQSWKQNAEKQEDGTWKTSWELTEKEAARCTVETAKDPKPCEMVAPKPGQFLLRAETKDGEDRRAVSAIDVYVYGKAQVTWRTDNANKIELIADREEYAAGEVAKVLVKSPFPRGEGLVSFEANGILRTERLSLDGSAHVIEVPIVEKHVPNVRVSVNLARGRLSADELPEGASAAEDLGRPSFAEGEVNLKVSLAPKTLEVSATPSRPVAGPGESIEVSVEIQDSDAKPVSGEVAVMLVDEGVLALLGYETPDPLAAFWPERHSGAVLTDLRNLLLKQEKDLQLALDATKLRRAKDGGGIMATESLSVQGAVGRGAPPRQASAPMEQSADAWGSADELDAGESGGEPIVARTEFASTAFWAGSVETGADGKATLKVKLPDNLTTFRVMVIAADAGDRFGKTDGQVTVRKRVLVRPSLPRFLNYGDSFEAAVVVHNETGRTGQVEVIARGTNLLFEEAPRKAILLASGQAAEVRWKAKAVAAGVARVQFAAAFDGSTDAAEISIPVKLPATGEAFATYGTTDGSIAQPVLVPEGVIPEFGALELRTSSTALTTLGDAIDYLYEYPYECLEQTASRILPIFALKDVIRDFELGTPEKRARADRLANDGIARIVSLQNYDGGFKFWPQAGQSDPWVSGYAAFVLLRGKEAGYDVPERTLTTAKYYLNRAGLNPPTHYGEYWRRAVQTQSVLVLTEMGEKPTKVADELYRDREKLPFFSRAHLMVSWKRMAGANDRRVVELLRGIDNAAVQTPSTAHYAEVRTESRALKLLMHSEARTDAIVLWAMLETRPKDPLIPKVVKGLNDARIRGRWRTTQENAWVLLGMGRYYGIFEKQAPEFVARAWLEDLFVAEAKFAGRSMEEQQTKVPMESLLAQAGTDRKKTFVIAKEGPGRLYYRLGLTYAPTDLKLPPEEQGFSVSRVYEPVEKEADVSAGPDGSWTMKAGATVRVRLTIVVPDRRYYAAVVDPLPAGLEAVNAALATSAQSRPGAGLEKTYDTWSWYSFWSFNHVQIRDDRVEIFADQLPAGIYEYTYLARATTLGNFVVPPLKAEEMYAPEVFGRNATARVTVK